MVKIRLRRVGAKKRPSYRVMVTDVRAPRDGVFIDTIGHYDPLTEPETVVIDGQLLPDGVFTQGESVDLINIPSVSGELYDRLGDRITTRIEGIKFESRSISLQARGLKTRNIGFQAIRLTEE